MTCSPIQNLDSVTSNHFSPPIWKEEFLICQGMYTKLVDTVDMLIKNSARGHEAPSEKDKRIL
jgi:hypothetical protein